MSEEDPKSVVWVHSENNKRWRKCLCTTETGFTATAIIVCVMSLTVSISSDSNSRLFQAD